MFSIYPQSLGCMERDGTRYIPSSPTLSGSLPCDHLWLLFTQNRAVTLHMKAHHTLRTNSLLQAAHFRVVSYHAICFVLRAPLNSAITLHKPLSVIKRVIPSFIATQLRAFIYHAAFFTSRSVEPRSSTANNIQRVLCTRSASVRRSLTMRCWTDA